MIWSIAWKNIWRNKLRSSVIISAIIIGMFGAIFTAALVTGMKKQRIKAAINKETSHIQIHEPKFLENNETKYFINDAENIFRKLLESPEIKAVSLRTKIIGIICSASTSSGVQIVGVQPFNEKKVTQIYETICDSCGKYLDSAKKNSIIVSKKLAEKLKIKLRSKIVLKFQSTDGNLIEAAFKVAGIYNTSNTVFDEMNVFIKADDINILTNNEIKPNEIAIILKNNDILEEYRNKLKKTYPQLNVMTWKEISPELGMIDEMSDVKLYIILGIILIALLFGIVNTMLMVVLERIRELGMLMAIGMNKLKIFIMIMLETVLLTLTGGVLGMFISGIIIFYLNRYGMDLSAVSKSMESFGFDAVVYPEVSVGYFFNLTIFILVTGIIASIYPARKALKFNPAESVRAD